MKNSKVHKILSTIARRTLMRPRDLKRQGIPQDYLWELHRRGLVERVGRGLYSLRTAAVSEHHSLAEVCKRAPRVVICLLSALRFHGMTTQSPSQIWIALNKSAHAPKLDTLQLRIVRFSGQAFTEGIDNHMIEGVPVRVYNAAKTVADCFKYRHKIGKDIAVEALRDCLTQHKCTPAALWNYARICRVSNVMKPYLEALT